MTVKRVQVKVQVRFATTLKKMSLMALPHRSSPLALVLHTHTLMVRSWCHKKPRLGIQLIVICSNSSALALTLR